MLGHFSDALGRDAASAHRAIARGQRQVQQAIANASDEAALLILLEKAAKSLASAHPNLDKIATTTLWQVVILVTCAEAYLHDILADAAGVDESLMANSEQIASYQEIKSAPSLASLTRAMQERWARRWLNDGGPTRWIDRFQRMGAKGFSPSNLAATLELIWGLRHVIVHRAGAIDPDFRAKHPDWRSSDGRVTITVGRLKQYVEAVFALLTPIERFALARWPSLAVPDEVRGDA